MSAVRTTWLIEGMFCPHCEATIQKALQGVPGISDAKADYRRATLTALWDEKRLPSDRLARILEAEGYALKNRQAPWRGAIKSVLFLLALAALHALMTLTPLSRWVNAFPLAQAGMSLGALFLVGMMTSVHCVAMCGGINLAQSASAGQKGQGVLKANLLYQAGRVLSYALIGMLVGALGSVLSISDTLRGAIQLLAAAFMILMALNLLGGFDWTRRLSLHLPLGLSTKLAVLTQGRSSFLIGLANGLMPCGPLQSMQLFALSTGSWTMGGLSMLAFALGTVPLMLGFGFVGGKLNQRWQKPMRYVSAALVAVMGVSMLSSGLALTGIGVNLPTRDPANIAVVADGSQAVWSELDYGSYPTITVQAGMPVTWTFHADEEKINSCNGAFVIPEYGIRVTVQPGDNVITFTPEEEGTVPYYCWMGMIRSSIRVVSSMDGVQP